jgi:hypothetical protein
VIVGRDQQYIVVRDGVAHEIPSLSVSRKAKSVILSQQLFSYYATVGRGAKQETRFSLPRRPDKTLDTDTAGRYGK